MQVIRVGSFVVITSGDYEDYRVKVVDIFTRSNSVVYKLLVGHSLEGKPIYCYAPASSVRVSIDGEN